MAQDDSNADPTLDGIINNYLQQNTGWVNAAKNDDDKAERERKLEERVKAIADAYGRYGQAAFKPKPKASEMDSPDFDYRQNSYAGQVPFSPYDPTKVGVSDDPEVPAPINRQQQAFLNSYQGGNQLPVEAPPTGLLAFADRNSKSATDALYRGELGALQLGYNLDPGARALLLGRDEAADKGDFAKAEQLQREAEDYSPSARKGTTGSVAGGFGAGLLTYGVDAFNRPFNVVKDTGSLAKGYGDLALSAPEYIGQMALGKVSAGLPTRLAAGAVGGAGIDIAATATRNAIGEPHEDVLDPERIADAAGGGAAIAAGGSKKPPKVNEAPKPEPVKTGDPDIDTGIAAGMKSTDLFTGKPEDLPTPSTNIPLPKSFDISQKANVDTTVDTTSSINKMNEVDKAYEQKAADEKARRDLVPDILDELSPKAPDSEQSATALDQGAPPSNTLGDTNPQLAGLRDQLTRERATKEADFSQPDNVEVNQVPPSINVPKAGFKLKTKQQMPELDFDGKTSLDQAEAPAEHTPQEREARRQSLLDQIAKETGQEVPRATRPVDASQVPSNTSLHPSVLDALDRGELTGAHVLDSIADSHGGLYDQHPEARAFTNVLRQAGEKLGGLDTKIELFDPNNPEHADMMARDPRFQDSAGVYDPKTNKIYINGEKNLTAHALVHEVAHGITEKAISLGEDGKLEGPARQAFDRLNVLFDTIRPHLLDKAAEVHEQNRTARPSQADNINKRQTYGLTNLHELMSEMFSSPVFRDHLKSLKLDSLDQAKMGMGRLALGKVRNMYEAVVKNVRQMLGLSPKADNAMDALFSASHDFLHSFDGKQAAEVRESNSRNQARFAPKDEETKRPYIPPVIDPLSRWQQFKGRTGEASRKLFTWSTTGPERDIRAAKETGKGQSNLNLMNANEAAGNLNRAMRAEQVDHAKVTDYMQGKDAKALDKYPETKKVVDEQFKKPSRQNALELARQLASNPNARKVDLDLAQEMVENKDYTTRSYQGEGFSAQLMRNAKDGNPEAQVTVNKMRSWIKDALLPTPDVYNKTIAGLRTMAKALGIDTPKELEGITNRGEKRQKLIDLIQKTVPDYKNVDHAVDRLMFEIAGLTNKGNSPVAKYWRGVRVGDILTTRKEVPPVLREFWGEIKDPASLLTQTLVKQGNGIAQLKTQGDIRQAGEGKYLFADKMKAPDGFTEKLNGRKFGSLQNMYTSPEIKRLLDSQIELSSAGKTLIDALMSGNPDQATQSWLSRYGMGLWTGAVGGYKTFRLASDPGYYAMYAVGGPQIAMLHGIANPAYGYRGLMAHLAEVSPSFLRGLPEQMQAKVRADRDLIVKSGMNEASAIGEQFDMITSAKLREAAKAGGSYETISKMLSTTMSHAMRGAKEMGITALSLTDGWAKRAALFQRMDVLESFYKRTGEEKTPEQIRAEAADWVKDTTITNSRTPAIVRLTEKLGGSQGLIYGVETIRNTIKAGEHVVSDMARAIKANDPILFGHALKQMGGVTGAILYYPGLVSAAGGTVLAALSGMKSSQVPTTDKKQEYLQERGSRFEGQRPYEIDDPNNPNKKNQYLWAPGDRNGFYYQTSQPLTSLYDDYQRMQAGEKIDPKEAVQRAFSALTGTVFANSFVKRVMNAVEAKPPGWMNDAPLQKEQSEIFYRNLGLSEHGADRMLALEDLFRPGVLRNWDSAKEINASPAMKTLMSLGLGVVKTGTDADLSDKTGAVLDKKLTDIKKSLGDTIKNPADFSNDVLDSSYKQAFKDTYDVMKQAKNAVDYAKANGLKTYQVARSMKIGNIPEEVMGEVLQGKMNPAPVLYGDMSSKLEKEYMRYEDNPEMQKKLVDVYRRRMKHIAELTREYNKLTPEQIEGL